MKPRLAIIGCGAVVQQRHLPALTRLGWSPALLVDPDVEAAQQRFRREVAASIDGRLDEIDAAIVAAPNRLHARLAVPLLEAGKSVLIEKPLATTVAECDAMCVAATRPSSLGVIQWWRFRAVNAWTRALLAADALGEIESFDLREGNPHSWAAATDAIWRSETAGGGILADMGAHVLDLLLWWLGDFSEVRYRDDSYGGVESDCRLELTLRSGAVGTVELSRTRTLRNTIVIRGREGWVEVALATGEFLRGSENALAFSTEALTPGNFPRQLVPGLFSELFQDWLGAIEENREPAITGRAAARYVALIEECYGSREDWRLPWVHTGSSDSQASSGDSVSDARSFWRGRKVLVTGASGFIGGRLVEQLHLERQADVRATVRGFATTARLARLPIEIVQADLTDEDALALALAGRDTVFHLAYDHAAPKANLPGIKTLAEACLHHGVRRLVHVSTMAVYDTSVAADPTITEDSAPHPGDWAYARTKLDIERELQTYARERGLPVTIVQPTIVYGPFGGAFTDMAAARLLAGDVVLPAETEGVCNAVYVDDVVSSLLLAAEVDAAVGERFLVSGSDAITWHEFYQAHQDSLGVDSLRAMPEEEIRKQSRDLLANVRLFFAAPKKAILKYPALHRSLIKLYELMPESLMEPALRLYFYQKKGERVETFLPTDQDLAMYKSRSRVSTDKARQVLGYRPSYDFASGMDLTGAYLRWAYPGAPRGEE